MDLCVKDVAELLSMPESAVEQLSSEGSLPAYCIEGQYRFSRLEVEDWLMHEHQAETASSARKGLNQFCLYRALNQGDVLPSAQSRVKEEVIVSSAHVIADVLHLDGQVLSELLLEREALVPTAIGHGIAIPHTRELIHKNSTDRLFVLYAKEPLEYGALDHIPVHTLFFLFAASDKGHLQLLAKLAHFARSPAAMQLLRLCPPKRELLETFRAWEAGV
jgi:PTS system nitrogen regulatory IIA component